MSEESESFETVKYYTRARKFPQLLGKFPDGTKIPGGPYTIQQLIAGVGILAFGGFTMGIWGVFGGIGNIVVLFGLAFAAIFIIGRLPMNGRNPFFALIGLYKVSMAPRGGRYQGRPIRIRRPRTVTHKTNVWVGPLPVDDPLDAMQVSLDPVEADSASRRRLAQIEATVTNGARALPTATSGRSDMPLTGVQALLAKTGTEDHDKAVR